METQQFPVGCSITHGYYGDVTVRHVSSGVCLCVCVINSLNANVMFYNGKQNMYHSNITVATRMINIMTEVINVYIQLVSCGGVLGLVHTKM